MNVDAQLLKDMLADQGVVTMQEWTDGLGRLHRLAPRRAAAMAEE